MFCLWAPWPWISYVDLNHLLLFFTFFPFFSLLIFLSVLAPSSGRRHDVCVYVDRSSLLSFHRPLRNEENSIIFSVSYLSMRQLSFLFPCLCPCPLLGKRHMTKNWTCQSHSVPCHRKGHIFSYGIILTRLGFDITVRVSFLLFSHRGS